MAKKIKLTKGNYAIVDDADFGLVSKWKWHTVAGKYAAHRLPPSDKNPSGEYIYMHRYIMDTPAEMDTDHKNGDGFDNRRRNLRVCSTQDNLRNKSKMSYNTSGFKGVIKVKGGWRAQLQVWVNGLRTSRSKGTFKTVNEAARAYDQLAIEYYGSFAKLNFGKRG